MEIVTTPTTGTKILETHGVVTGHESKRFNNADMSFVRDRALKKLEKEATNLGANAVVGLRIEISTYSQALDTYINFLCYGTAVTVGSAR